MAGSFHILDASSPTVTTTVKLTNAPPGGHTSATFLWDILVISGTWNIALYFDIGTNRIKIAELTGRTAAGLVRIPLTSDFDAVKMAIPNPTSIVYTEAVAGTLTTSAVTACYGDS